MYSAILTSSKLILDYIRLIKKLLFGICPTKMGTALVSIVKTSLKFFFLVLSLRGGIILGAYKEPVAKEPVYRNDFTLL